MDQQLRLARTIAKHCTEYKDLMGGSSSEYDFLQWLLTQIDNPLLSYELHPVDVLTWTNKFTRISIGNMDFRAVAMPLTLGGSGIGKLTMDIDNVEGKVLLTDFPEDMDDAKYIYIKAMNKGALAVIFRDKYPNVLRRIVVTTTPDYTWNRASPPTVPAFVVPKEVGDELSKHVDENLEFMSDADTRVNTGYNLVINYESDNEDRVLLVAHHDHWLSGYADDCIGLGISMELLNDLLRNKNFRRSLTVISFTAEEAGDPGYASLYWAYGSSKFVDYMEKTKYLDNVYAVVDLDVVGREYVLHTSEDISAQLSQVVEAQWEFPKPYFDALNFEIRGIPSITLSSLDDYWDVYHTDKDTENETKQEVINKSYETTKHLLNYLLNNDLNPAPYTSVLIRDVESVGIAIENTTNDWKTYKLLKYLLSKYLVEYRRDGSVKTIYTNSILSYVRRYLNVSDINQVPLRVEEMGSGKVLFDVSTIKNNQQLSNYLTHIIASITSELESKLKT